MREARLQPFSARSPAQAHRALRILLSAPYILPPLSPGESVLSLLCVRRISRGLHSPDMPARLSVVGTVCYWDCTAVILRARCGLPQRRYSAPPAPSFRFGFDSLRFVRRLIASDLTVSAFFFRSRFAFEYSFSPVCGRRRKNPRLPSPFGIIVTARPFVNRKSEIICGFYHLTAAPAWCII